jgi:type II secretory pathway component GspD/PulD (secretin)
MLERLAAIIESIDIPNAVHTYTFVNIDPVQFEIEQKLLGLLGGEQPYIAVDAIHRQVSFRCPPEQAEAIIEVLKKWDAAVQQVRIEAEVLSVNSRLAQNLGISWQAVLNQVQGDVTNPVINVMNNFAPVLPTGSPSGALTVGNLPGTDYTATITALATDSDTQVLARPSVLVRNNEEAIFTSAREEPYTVVTVAGDTQTTLQDVRFLNVGITLAVTPTIHPDDQISLKIHLENSDLVQVRDGIPVVDRASAESTVGVRAGGTIILGGLRQRSRTLTRNGVPGLRKIPVVGNLFRNKKNDRTEFDIVLVLRPTLIDPSVSEAARHEPLAGDVETFVSDMKAGPKGDKPKKPKRNPRQD